MRKETSNQFTEGMVCDMNPINTPNTVLTDNLNGTIITYNGNEFSLQNDRGNYELKHCRLKPNYIPVGIKEYGDVLYIVSYNPLDKHVEIGSYPSPLIISTPKKNSSNNIIKSVIKENIIDKQLKEGYYSELIKSAHSIIFNGEDLKLNPGDEYCLQVLNHEIYKYETIDYYLLDEDAITHYITDKIKIDTDETNLDYEHVQWIISGWIMMKVKLAEMGTSGLNVRYFYITEGTGEAFYSFNMRLNISDSYFLKKDQNGKSIIDTWCETIGNNLSEIQFRLKIEKQNQYGNWESVLEKEYIDFPISGGESEVVLGQSGWIDWYDDCRILWKNFSGKIENLNEADVIKVIITPMLHDEKYSIIYDNLKQEMIFDLKYSDVEPYNIGTKLYQFYVDRENNKQIINANITGPLVSSSIAELYYEIYSEKDNELYLVKDGKFDNWGIGNAVLQLEYTESFVKENIYLIKFIFKNNEGVELNTSSRILITSELFEDYIKDKQLFDYEINYDDWLNKFVNNITFTVDFENASNDSPNYTCSIFGINDSIEHELKSGDKRFLENDLYCTFQNENDISEYLCFKQNLKYKITAHYTITKECLQGPLWEYINYSYKTNGDDGQKHNFTADCYKKYFYKYNLRTDDNFNFTDLKIKTYKDFNNENVNIKDYCIKLSVNGNDRLQYIVQTEYLKNEKWNIINTEGAGALPEGGSRKITLLKEKMFDLPFSLIKIWWKLGSGFDMWNCVSPWAQEDDNDLEPDFIDELTNRDKVKVCYFIALNQSQDEIPILIPVSDNEGTALQIYKNFCEKIYFVQQNGDEKNVSDYTLMYDNEEILNNINLIIQVKADLNKSLDVFKSNILYDNILRKTIESEYREIYNNVIKSDMFVLSKDNNDYTKFCQLVSNINTDRAEDKQNYYDTPWVQEEREKISGVYFKDKWSVNDKLVSFFNENYTTGYLGRSPKTDEQYRWMFTYKQRRNDIESYLTYGHVLHPVRYGNQLLRLDVYWSDLNGS